jgi:hypothetical protein
MVLRPRRGAHGGVVNVEEEENIMWLLEAMQGGVVRLNQGVERWQTWWQTEFGIGGVRKVNLELEFLTVAMMSGKGKRRRRCSGA